MMTPSELVKKMLYDRRMSQRDLALMLGYKSQGAVSNILNRNTMNLNTLSIILGLFNYEIVVRPVDNPKEEVVLRIE